MKKRSVLLIEDDLPIARVYQEYLRNEPYVVTHVSRGRDALNLIDAETPDTVILDLKLPDMDGLDILRHIKKRALGCSVIVITAHGSITAAVEAMREGAADFMLKPFTADRLIYTLRHTTERQQLNQDVKSFKAQHDRSQYCGFTGASPAMQAIYHTIDNAAPSIASVFITGESGTGKELCAEALHLKSPRADKPFITLNCGAIPGGLMESEIFGHVKGAFTGAIADRDGAAKMADGGTLFLDEICEMDPALQVKLLRFIQTGTIQKVGATKLEKVDIRFVCATNKNPWNEVNANNFREDLYYRLHVIPIHLPPLQDRGDDIMEIANKFLDVFSKAEGKKFNAIGEDAMNVFMSHPWPGNVRQLQNAIQNAIVLNDGEVLNADMLPSLDGATEQTIATSSAPVHTLSSQPSLSGEVPIRPMWQVEREMIEAAMAACSANVHKAAALLEISPSTIYRRIREDGNEVSA